MAMTQATQETIVPPAVVRLVCAACDTVHRVEHVELGKLYRCQKCRAGLRTLAAAVLTCPECDATTAAAPVEVSQEYRCSHCEIAPPMRLSFPVANMSRPVENGIPDTPPDDAPPMSSEGTEEQITQLLHEVVVNALNEILPLEQTRQADRIAAHARELHGKLSQQMQTSIQENTASLQATITEDLTAVRSEITPPEIDLGGIREELAAQGAQTTALIKSQNAALAESLTRVLETALEDKVGGVINRVLEEQLGNKISTVIEPRLVTLADRVEQEIAAPLTRTIEEKIPAALAQLQGDEFGKQVKRAMEKAQAPIIQEINRERASVPTWLMMALALPVFLLIGLLYTVWDSQTKAQMKAQGTAKLMADEIVRIRAASATREKRAITRNELLEQELQRIDNERNDFKLRAEVLEMKLRIQGDDPDIPSDPRVRKKQNP